MGVAEGEDTAVRPDHQVATVIGGGDDPHDVIDVKAQAWQRTVARPAGSTLNAMLGMPGQTLTVTS